MRHSWGPLTWYNNIWRLLGSVRFHENFEYLKKNSKKVLSSKRWKNCNVSVGCLGWVCRTKLGCFNMLNVRNVRWNEFDFCDAYRNKKTIQTIWSKYFESKPLKSSFFVRSKANKWNESFWDFLNWIILIGKKYVLRLAIFPGKYSKCMSISQC